jgi:hypothetical protein
VQRGLFSTRFPENTSRDLRPTAIRAHHSIWYSHSNRCEFSQRRSIQLLLASPPRNFTVFSVAVQILSCNARRQLHSSHATCGRTHDSCEQPATCDPTAIRATHSIWYSHSNRCEFSQRQSIQLLLASPTCVYISNDICPLDFTFWSRCTPPDDHMAYAFSTWLTDFVG